ncbi:MAG: phosphoenolpyruvate--protein phosphotransferase [Lentisphaeraceae bacterium]|nr:phosphoenolpyruvate--protein phosphotransferase [Lentisphaeraceae bacterium]
MLKNTVLNISKAVTDAILKHENVSSILDNTVELICHQLGVESCCIYSYVRDREVLELVATKGLTKQSVGSTIRTNEGLAGHVYTRQHSVNIIHPQKHPQYVCLALSGEDKFQAYLGIPMMVGNNCVGVLALLSAKAKKFHENIVDMTVNLAAQLAIVVANADVDKVFKDHSTQKRQIVKVVESESEIVLRGVSISGGAVCAQVFQLQSDDYWKKIEVRYVNDREAEMQRLLDAIEQAKKETIEIQERAAKIFIEADASIFFAQLLFLEDPNFVSDIKHGIDFYGMKAGSSVKVTVEKYIEKFRSSNDAQLMERVIDLMDVGVRIVQYLIDDLVYLRPQGDQKMLFVGDDIMPSDLMRISTDNILGIVCRLGGSTSHAAILARSLAIPAVMGVSELDGKCENGDLMLIDGDQGLVIVKPTEARLQVYEERLSANFEEEVSAELTLPSVTADGQRIKVLGNICMLSDFELMKRYHNDGVGLYRTEFMYMMHESFPSENEQYRIFRSVAKMSQPNEVTIRALDIGGDKPLKYFDLHDEVDPMLGFRSLRILLQHREIFEPHLRAMLRASQRGNIRILFPMVAHYEDIIAVKEVIAEIMEDMVATYGKNFTLPPIGAMIEMPSTIWQLDEILDELDYISIGTNDLVQYLFAVDRGNSRVEDYFKPMHPIVIKALRHIVKRANKKNKGVSICGEIAGNPLFLPLLLGVGLKELSMPALLMSQVKPLIAKVKIGECRSLVNRVVKFRTEHEVRDEVMGFMEKRKLL